MKSYQFLGAEYTSQDAFKVDYPAYATYWNLVKAGADTPHKIECAMFGRYNKARAKRLKNARSSSVQAGMKGLARTKRRKAA